MGGCCSISAKLKKTGRFMKHGVGGGLETVLRSGRLAERDSAIWDRCLAVAAALSVGFASPVFAAMENGDTAERVVITGTRPTVGVGWGPYHLVTWVGYSVGGWQSEDEMLDARDACLEMGWKWPKSKEAISAALHDVRCNPATASSSARTITSRDTGEVRWAAATTLYANVRLAEKYKPGSTFEVVWADSGSSKYIVTGGLGSVALNPVELSSSFGSGSPVPSPNCENG